jgi:RNA 3'-terminal phosphate cyclase (ATP)
MTCARTALQVVAHEAEGAAEGDGTGLLLVARTSTACLLAASGRGERGVTAEAVGSTAAAALLEALHSGACVDDW